MHQLKFCNVFAMYLQCALFSTISLQNDHYYELFIFELMLVSSFFLVILDGYLPGIREKNSKSKISASKLYVR
jgi:hypothetical protein